tara:strand:+ start:300 stop:527 length:228 start_codon:yes stop_codon:yes gene_type:complete
MATNDFVCDLANKLMDDKIEYLVIAIQKGDKHNSANAYYNITSDDGAEMILTTVAEVFELDHDTGDDPNFKEGAD